MNPPNPAPTDHVLTLQRRLAAPRAAVWRCWTEPALVRQWFCPAPWTVPEADFDLRAGGRMNTVMAGPQGERVENEGIWLAIEPMRRLVFTDAFTEGFMPAPTPFMTGVVELADAAGGGTLFTWSARHANAQTLAQHQAMGWEAGWNAATDQLDALAQTVSVQRPAAPAMSPPTGASAVAPAVTPAITPAVTPAAWQQARADLLADEKAMTRSLDRLAAARRRLPRLRVADRYRFETPQGPARLADLFDGRRQLIVYHHMLRPSDPAPCPGCAMVADSLPHLAHLHARDTTLVMVSRAPLPEIAAFQARMGWTVPWFETGADFNADHDVTDGFGLNVFLRDGDAIDRTYFTTGRGVESLGSVWSLLDLTPFGRQESWQDAPAGTPQDAPYRWWRLHDAYGADAGGCCGG